jgi:prepilin-type processing-associated H-X9-DG protein/prepilin-type N-terminal cleavage/methylation domain-containing protein
MTKVGQEGFCRHFDGRINDSLVMPVSSPDTKSRGFTLVELLAVLTVISLLTALLVPTLSRGRARAHATACASTLRQLGMAFQLYLQDNVDGFPTSAPQSGLGAQPEDWVWWQVAPGQVTMRDPRQGSVMPYLGQYDPRYLRCPADRHAEARQVLWKRNPGTEQYFYSYSLNAHSDVGMASYISRDRSVIILNKSGRIRNPAGKIMLAEEKGAANDGPGDAVIDDGRWQPLGYPLTMRHSGKANVAFADGHVEMVQRDFAGPDHPEHFDPAY